MYSKVLKAHKSTQDIQSKLGKKWETRNTEKLFPPSSKPQPI